MMFKRMSILCVVFLIALLSYGEEEDKSLVLKIGNEALKNKTMAVSPGKIYSARAGKAISFEKMISDMKGSRFIYVGETHNNFPMHDIQLKVIQALYEADRNLSIGLEMFPVTFQKPLNKWSLGILSKCEFIREAQWYVNWGYNFAFYEKIFQFAKENAISLYALNVPRELITKIRMKGWEALSDEEKKLAPSPDLSYREHRMLIRTIFESAEIPHQMKGKGMDMMFEGLYRAQSAWDEAMAHYAHKAFSRDQKRMVILAGSGHLLYNLGINRRNFERSRLPFKTMISVAIPEEKQSLQISRSYADYIWGIPEEERPAYPSIGLKFKKIDDLANLIIERNPVDGVAQDADFKKGDIVLSVNGKNFADINELRIYLAQFQWGNEVKFRLLRTAKEIEVVLKFQFQKYTSE